MRIRLVLMLVIGFVLGVVCTFAVLWRTGALRAAALFPLGSPTAAPLAQLNPLPDTSASANLAAQTPLNPPPPSDLPATGETARAGEADREMPSAQLPGPYTVPQGPPPISREALPRYTLPDTLVARGLLLPVMGADPSHILDTFNDARDDHRHEAVDIMAPRGTPVVAVDEGNIVKLFKSARGGLTVYQFDDAQQYCYYYAHLDRYAEGIKEGMRLRKGDTMGYVGSTGDAQARAPHLHFSIFKLGPEKRWWEGTAINPYPLLVGTANHDAAPKRK